MSIRSFLARVRWFANGVMGADKYQKYLAHHRASGCAHAPMTEREFWKDYTDSLDKNPGARSSERLRAKGRLAVAHHKEVSI